jgi:hypothetical protein
MADNQVNPPGRKINFKYAQGTDINDFQKPNQPYLVDLITLEKLFLQTIPVEIEVNAETNWVALAAPGRNNPNYQFSGSEDSLEFDITWYANTEGKDDVLKKCKWLQSLAKNDGYDNPPHPIKFVFGDLFKSAKWIVFHAPYKLGMFDRSKGMLPGLATQHVVLKRVTETNMSRTEFLKLDT